MTAAKKLVDDKLLKSLIPFGELGDHQFAKLNGQYKVESYEAGKVLFKHGERDQRTYFLIAGQINLRYADGAIKTVIADTPQARYALVPVRPRQATATAKSPVTVLTMDVELFDEILTWGNQDGVHVSELESQGDQNDWMTCFLQSKVFLRLPAQNIQALMMRLEEVPVKAGQVVIRQGDDDGYYYIIKSGRCKVTRKHTPQDKPIELATLSVGEGFGEEAIITNNRRGASVTMVENGCLMRLSRNEFDRLLVEPLISAVNYDEVAFDERTVFLDVRNYDDYVRDGINGSENIAITEMRLKINTFRSDKRYVICSNTGSRASAAAFLLCQQGIDAVVLRYGLENLPTGVKRGNGNIKNLDNIPVVDNVVNFTKDSVDGEAPDLQPVKANGSTPVTAEQAMNDPRVQALFSKAKRRVSEESGRAKEAEQARLKAEQQASRLQQEAADARQELEKAKQQAEKAAKDSAAAARWEAKKEAARLRELELGAKQAEMEEAVRQAEEEARRAKEADAALAQAEREIENLKKEMQTALERAQEEASKSTETIRQVLEQEAKRQKEEADRVAVKEAQRAREAEQAHHKAQQEIERLKAEAEAAREKMQQEAEKARQEAEQTAARVRAEELAREQVAKEIATREAQEAAKKTAAAEQARKEAEAEIERLRKEAERARIEAQNQAHAEAAQALAAKQAEAQAAIELARREAQEEIEKMRLQAEKAKESEEARRRAEEEVCRVKQQAEQDRLRIEEQAIRAAEAARAEAVEEVSKLTASKQSEMAALARQVEEQAKRVQDSEQARLQAEMEMARLKEEAEQASARMQDQLSSEIARSEIEHEVAKARAIELANKQAEIEEVTNKADLESQRAKAAEDARQQAASEIEQLKREVEDLRRQQQLEAQQHPNGDLSADEQKAARTRAQALEEKQAAMESIAKIAADETARAHAADDARKVAEKEIERLRMEVEVATLQAQTQIKIDAERAEAERQATQQRAAELARMQALIADAEQKAQQQADRAHQAEEAQRHTEEQLARLKAAEEANVRAQEEIQRLKTEAGLAYTQAQEQAKLTAEEIKQKAELEIQRARAEEAQRKQQELEQAARKAEHEAKRAELAEQARKAAELEIMQLKAQTEAHRIKAEKAIRDSIQTAKKELNKKRLQQRAAQKARRAALQQREPEIATDYQDTSATVHPLNQTKSTGASFISDQAMWETALGSHEEKTPPPAVVPQQVARTNSVVAAQMNAPYQGSQPQQLPENRPVFRAREVNPHVNTQDVTGMYNKVRRSGGLGKYIMIFAGFCLLAASGYYLTLSTSEREQQRSQIQDYIEKETPLSNIGNNAANKTKNSSEKQTQPAINDATDKAADRNEKPLSIEERLELKRQKAIEEIMRLKKAKEGPVKSKPFNARELKSPEVVSQKSTATEKNTTVVAARPTAKVKIDVVKPLSANTMGVTGENTQAFAYQGAGHNSNSLDVPVGDDYSFLPLNDGSVDTNDLAAGNTVQVNDAISVVVGEPVQD